MKSLKYIFISCFVIFIIACESNETDLILPGPSIQAQDELIEMVTQKPGNDIFQGFTLQSANGLQTFEVFQDGVLVETISFTDEITASYFFEYTIPQGTPIGTTSQFNFVLTDQENQQTSQQIRLIVDSTFEEIAEVVNGTDVIRIKGQLDEDYTMEAVNTYVVDSTFSVEGNSTLTIEAGTEVYFKTFDTQDKTSRLVITQGSKIMAEGTADTPILFTSDKLLKGETPTFADWGGVILYGKAPSNKGAVILDGGFRYGGNEPNDNSGVLRYIRSEYAGNVDNDVHAFKFFGVGSATQIDHLQVFRNRNISFRLKGGRVNLKYLSAIGHGGYALWAGDGWQGKGQFWVFQTDVQSTTTPSPFWNIARSVEMRSDADNPLIEPRTNFTIANVTCIGNGNTVGNGTRRGVRFRTGAFGTFQNAIITEFPNDGARVEDLATEVLGVDMIFENIRSFNNFDNYDEDADFFAAGSFNVTEDAVPGISLTNFVGSETSSFDPVSLGGFFTSAPYIGAIESAVNDWTTEGNWFKNLDGSIR